MTTRTWGGPIQAVLQGRDHALVGRNGQDHAVVAVGDGWAVGAVADGCGEGEGSELGARLSALVGARCAGALLASGQPVGELPRRVGLLVMGALAQVAETAAGDDRRAQGRFVREHLAATLWIAAQTTWSGAVFGWGDGFFVVGDRIEAIDEGGRPRYLAHALGAGEAPAPSASLVVADAVDLGVATDGWEPDLLARAPRDVSPSALLRWMRLRQRAGAFRDDGAVAWVPRVPAGETPSLWGARS